MPTKITPTDVTPGTTGSYQTVDITSLVGSDAGNIEAVHLRIRNIGSAASAGVRAIGSVNTHYGIVAALDWFDTAIKVDGSDQFSCQISSADIAIYVMGYSTTDEAEFLVDGNDFESQLTEATISNVDLSAVFTETAQLAFGSIFSTGFNYSNHGFRPDGSATAIPTNTGPRSGDGPIAWWAMYCVSEVFDCIVTNLGERTVLCNGILYTGVTGSATRSTHDPHASGQAASWQSTDLTAGAPINPGDPFVLAVSYINSWNGSSRFGLRPDSGGPSDFSGPFHSRVKYSFMPMATGDVIDMYADDSQADPRVVLGVFASAAASPSSGPTEIDLAGAQPAATGALSALQTLARSLAGAQPAPSGVLSALQTLQRSLAGDQPSATGSISAALQLAQALAGNQPAPSGALTAISTLFRALAGNQPAPSGTLAALQTLAISLSGNQPSATGALAVQQTLQRTLSGDQPAASGSVSAETAGEVSLSGDQPSATGVVTALQTLQRTLSGDQPAASGALAVLQTLLRSLAGDQPAASGSLSAQSIVAIDLAGNQPAATGSIAAEATSGATLSGNQPAATGALIILQTLQRTLSGSQPAAVGVLSALQTLAITLAGNQPSASGVLSASALLFVSVAGNQPSATGAVSSQVVLPGNHVISQTARSAPSTIIHANARDTDGVLTQSGRLN